MALEGLALVLVYTAMAGAAIPIGGALGFAEHFRRGHFRKDFLRFVVAFGGGVILAAVALVLLPHGLESVGMWVALASFSAGAVIFLVVDRAIEKRGGHAAQLMAMVMDFVPEALALGAAVALGGTTGPLLALLIGLQNLPEGFNGFRELQESGRQTGSSLVFLAALALLGPASGLVGFYVLSQQPDLVGVVMIGASGGLLYLLFQDVAPLAHREGHWVPTLGAVLGFALGMAAQFLVGG